MERELKIPKSDGVEVEGELLEATIVEVGATRIYRRAGSLTLNNQLKPVKNTKSNGSTLNDYFGGVGVSKENTLPKRAKSKV